LIQYSNQNILPKAYIKGINGLRTIFVIPVVIAHIIYESAYFGFDIFFEDQQNESPIILKLGVYGVGIFFGISGFLIPYLLGLERVKRGEISIKRFYARRVLRIFPIYYINILLCLLIYYFFSIEFRIWDLMIVVIYVVNIPYVFGGELPLLSHYWTLAVEEQFYIVWPWLNKFTNRQLLMFCWFLLIIFLIVRQILIVNSSEIVFLKMMSHVWIQCILIGAIFALYYLDYRTALMRVAENKWVIWGSWSLLLIGSFNGLSGINPLDFELITIASCMILVNQNSEKVYLKLEIPIFKYTGKLSYGIYIFHYPILYLISKMIPWEYIANQPLRFFLVSVVVFGISLLVAQLFYVLVEKPFLKLKEKKYTYVHGVRS